MLLVLPLLLPLSNASAATLEEANAAWSSGAVARAAAALPVPAAKPVALAADSFAALMSAAPGATPFDVLKKLFYQSLAPASLDDIPASRLVKHCAEVASWDVHPSQVFGPTKRSNVVKPGSPAVGPLFPAVPDETMTVIDDISCDESVCTSSSLSRTGTELVQQHMDAKNMLAYKVSLRKNATFLTYELFIPALHSVTSKDVLMYGYCWPD